MFQHKGWHLSKKKQSHSQDDPHCLSNVKNNVKSLTEKPHLPVIFRLA